jgi:hypothetical protein
MDAILSCNPRASGNTHGTAMRDNPDIEADAIVSAFLAHVSPNQVFRPRSAPRSGTSLPITCAARRDEGEMAEKAAPCAKLLDVRALQAALVNVRAVQAAVS